MVLSNGTDVKTADGEKVGTVDQLVIDPRSNDVTHVVVEKGFLFTEDRVIPAEDLTITDDEVHLNPSVDDLEDYPPYETTYYVSSSYTDVPPQWGGWAGAPLLHNPPLGVGGLGYVSRARVATHTPARHSQNVPGNAMTIDEGTKVMTADGEHAGDVKKTFVDSDENLTHLLISKGFLFTTERLIPVAWVQQMEDDTLRLSVPEQVVENLPEYEPQSG